jgi:hypothetical protein
MASTPTYAVGDLNRNNEVTPSLRWTSTREPDTRTTITWDCPWAVRR